jgi:hypothetical protein
MRRHTRRAPAGYPPSSTPQLGEVVATRSREAMTRAVGLLEAGERDTVGRIAATPAGLAA